MKVRATENAIVSVDGVPINVRQGEVADSKDPIVKAHGWLYEEAVEDTSNTPGTRRGQR